MALAELLPARGSSDDILEFGVIRELVGRLPVVSALTPLGKGALVPASCAIRRMRR